MIVPGQYLNQVYQALKKDSNGSEDQSVLCFAASIDADSVCASQLLLNLFNRESLHFTLIPVGCYEEVREHCAPLITAQEVKTVMLVNCGATEDVRSLCNLPSNIRIVILDHHRPVWHGHNNEDDMDTLVLVDEDDPVPKKDVPMYDQQLDNEVAESDDSASESDGSDDDDDADDDGSGGQGGTAAGRGRKRRRGDGEDETPPKRGPASRSDNAAARRTRAEEVDSYYSDRNGYGKPSSLLLFSLCHQLQHDDNFHIWCAIVGLTEQLLFQQISKQQYNTWREVLAHHVRMQQDIGQDDPAQDAGAFLTVPRHKVQVETCEDLRLTLLRYWTIEDSLRYTGYVAARLQTWRQKGLDNLRSLLTYMCIPLKAAGMAYKGLHDVYNGQLRSGLPRFAPQHMLAWDSLHFNSFRLLYKHEEVGASDMVFALLGLLTDSQSGGPDWQRTAFNNAQNALHVQRNLLLVERGIELAKQMCQDVVHECGLMITAGKVKGGRTADYRWVNVADSNALTNARFRHPTILRYMALFLRDATSCRYSSSDARRPMVVAGPPDERGVCCLVSVHAKQISGNRLQNNPFARPFIETAGALNIIPVKSAFENATYHIRKEDVTAFLGKLQEVVADYRAVAQQAQATET